MKTIKLEIVFASNEWEDNPIEAVINITKQIENLIDTGRSMLLTPVVRDIEKNMENASVRFLLQHVNNTVKFISESEDDEVPLIIDAYPVELNVYADGKFFLRGYHAGDTSDYFETETGYLEGFKDED